VRVDYKKMKIVSKDIMGIYDRGEPDECPPKYLLQCKNLMQESNTLTPRPGFKSIGANSKTQVTQISIFEPIPIAGVVSPKDIIHTNPGPAFIFNNTDFPGAAIWTGLSHYHSWINFFGRGYFTLHNTIVGHPTEKLQVYEGGASSRNALGAKPISVMAGVGAVGGNLGVGSYLVDVVYVTSTGYITKPSGTPINVTTFGSYKINLTVIPTGPAGTVARKIIMSKVIPNLTYTGNPNDYEFFFAPSGFINDNVTTVFALSEFDGNLIASADYLFDQLESVDSGVGIGEYNSRMIVWGESANPSILRVSKPGDPESISATSGFIIVDPTESGGVTNICVIRNNMYIFKSNRIFVTTDNGDDPTTWPVTIFDAGIGTECFGISRVFDSKGTHLSQFLIAGRSGLYIFDGLIRFPELTYVVQNIWDDIDPASFSLTRVALDPINKNIYVLITRTNGDKHILAGDYTMGMSSDKICWSIWESASGGLIGAINAIAIYFDPDGHVWTLLGMLGLTATFDTDAPENLDDSGSFLQIPFTCTLQSPVIDIDEQSDVKQITKIGVRARNASVGDITSQGVSAADSTKVSPVYTIPFVNSPNKAQDKWNYLPFVDNQPTVVLSILSTNRPRISRITIDGDTYGESNPQ